jgi:hypothetical protein
MFDEAMASGPYAGDRSGAAASANGLAAIPLSHSERGRAKAHRIKIPVTLRLVRSD